MTFKHKLSRRLALLFGSAALATLAIYACELPGTLTPPTGASQLVVSPHAVAAQPGQDVMFTAVGLTAEGDTADVDVTWSTTGGSISGQSRSTNGRRHYGHWKNSTCGSFGVAATSNPGGSSDTASVTVTCVASVTVTPPSAAIPQGQTLQLTATPIDTSGTPMTGQAVAWASSNGAVATVTGSGLVSAMAPGLATITATSGGKSGTAAITVTSVPVAAVDVAPAVATIPQGQTTQLTATPKDAAGNPLAGRAVTWASSNGAVATVNNSGLVSALAAGSATITATSEGQSGSAGVTVTPVPVASVAVSPPTASIQVGQTAQLTATPKDASGNALSGRVVNWTSSNNSVATVSSSGLVTGLAVGSATITATSEGQSGGAAVTVTAAPMPVASVAVTPATPSIQVGQTVQLTATPKDASGNTLTGRTVGWTSSNTAVATVSPSGGLVTGKAAGAATITATSEGKIGSAAVTVTQVPVASVAVSPATATIQIGQTAQLTATPKDASGNTLSGRVVTWGSSSTSIATVNTSGLVTGMVAGSATITATSEGKTGSATVTVTATSTGSGLKFDNLVVILMENHGYGEIYGVAPLMTSFADQNALFQNYTGITHPSEPNYVNIFGANTFGMSGDGNCCWSISALNIVDRLESSGLTWKAFAEGAGSSGTCSFSPPRSSDHFPFMDFSDMDTPSRCSHFLTTSSSNDAELIAELNSSNPANFIWLTPTDNHNMHDNSVSSGDSWLSGLVTKIMATSTFTSRRAALFVVFDEGDDESCPSGCSDRLYAVWAGPTVKSGLKPTTPVSHYSVLKTLEANWGFSALPSPAHDGSANSMMEVFK